jgi:hypothetical protein
MATTRKRTTKKKKKPSEVDVLFPGNVVTAQGMNGKPIKVTMNPLPLDKLPLVMESFERVMAAMLEAQGDQRVAGLAAVKEAVVLLPHCMDVEMNKLAASAAPDLLSVFIDQNITDDMLGKWMALAEKINKRVGGPPLPEKGQSSQSSQS